MFHDKGAVLVKQVDENGLDVPIQDRRVDIATMSVAKLVYGNTPSEVKTLTLASTDYALTGEIPFGAKYAIVHCDKSCIVAMGEGTSTTVGVSVGADQPTVFPITKTGIAGRDILHAQSATAGAVLRVTWMA